MRFDTSDCFIEFAGWHYLTHTSISWDFNTKWSLIVFTKKKQMKNCLRFYNAVGYRNYFSFGIKIRKQILNNNFQYPLRWAFKIKSGWNCSWNYAKKTHWHFITRIWWRHKGSLIRRRTHRRRIGWSTIAWKYKRRTASHRRLASGRR